MADVVEPTIRSRMMSRIRGKDTKPELVVRSGLFSRGLRFRLHVASLPGRPDIVIHKYRTAIFVQGCFWHAHQGCRYFKLPASNAEFWSAKLHHNQERDIHSQTALRTGGWRVAVVWECAIRADSTSVLNLICDFLHRDQSTIDIHERVGGGVSHRFGSGRPASLGV